MSDATNVPELDLVVGSMITTRPDEDRAAYEEEYESVSEVQDQLREEGIDVDLLSQPGTEIWEGSIETLGSLYQLSRLAAYLEHDKDIASVLEEGPVLYDDLDPAVTDIWDELVETRFPHLINLQGINSYFVPVDFVKPVWLAFENEEGEEDTAYFGSSNQLQKELTELEELLRQAKVPTQGAAFQALESLRDAAAQSLQNGLPIIVW
jgi:hypothetical protein